MIIIAEVSELTRKIKLPTDRVLSVNGDYQVDGIAFKLPATYEGDFDFSTAAARVHWTGVDKVEHTNLLTEEDENGYPLWIMPSELTQGGHGVIEFAVSFVATDATAAITKRWISDPVSFRNRRTVNGSNEDEEAEEETTYDRLAGLVTTLTATAATINDVKAVISRITNSSPVVVAAVADLSGLDTTKYQFAYVRADGYLYCYDGAAWQQGIKYGSYELDTTLKESGKAADAAAVGAKVSAIKEDLNAVSDKKLITGWASGYIRTDGTTTKLAVTSSTTDQYVVIPAAEGDVFELTMTGSWYGRAWAWVDESGNILSKANSNAVLSGEEITAPANTDILILVDKSGSPACYQKYYTLKRISNLENDVSSIKTENEGRDILIAKTAHTTTEYAGNIFDTSGGATGSPTEFSHVFDDGVYFLNPFTPINKDIRFYPVDQYGNAIKMFSSKTQAEGTYFNTSDRLYRLTFSGLTIHYEAFANLNNYNLNNASDDYYLTLAATPHHWKILFYGYSEGDAIERGLTKGIMSETYVAYSVPTTVNKFTEDLDEHINEIADESMGEILVPSYNLIDTDCLTYIEGYYRTKNGYYMPVTPGKAITCNAQSWLLTFYNSDYTSVGTAGSPNPYVASIVPETAAWATFRMGGVNGDNFGLVIWETDTVQNALYERPIVRPNKKIAAKYLDSDIYNYAVPDSLSQGIMQMARFAAIRADNEKHDAYRFATFNIKANSGTSGFKTYGDTLFDFAVDFCGIQENKFTGQEFHAACRPFQFGYYAGNYAETHLDNACVSRFEITETNDIIVFENSNGTFGISVYKILMPQHKHYPRRPTLSVYNFHGNLQIAKRLEEVDAIIAAIAEDTSDFIIVMGDTNSEVDTEGHRQSWDRLVAAGLTPAHNGESPTWPTIESPTRYSSMDNIFFSSHISLMNYGISDWHEYHTTDHDLVWADLIFDFDAVLKDTWEEPATVQKRA